ncbi:ABC transporter substrate-binding protein [Siminovitchia sp. 179-K 8D1 HS]|uniref:ABC transporter substrate-binding protein n=1 Tax=Siminovitchia sp. 179-K 8D1 HS TaxID=3142385 RepID=UPI0039A26025
MYILKNKRIILLLMNLILISILVLAGCSQGTGGKTDKIKIGVTGPLTGSTANSGIALKQGMELAVKEWNDKGGVEIDGEKLPIEMFFEDNQGKPAEGVSTAEKLLNNENVDFLIGDAFSSSVTMAVMELASQYEKPIMSGEAVSSAISEKVEEDPDKYKYFYKGNFSSEAYGEGAYSTIKSLIEDGSFDPKDKTIAFVVEDTDYGRSNVAEAQKLFEEDGWKQVTFETVDVGHTDFYPQLTKLKSLKPDVLITCFTAVSSGVALVKQFNETGIESLHLAIYYPLRPEFLEQAGDDANGLLWEPISYHPELIKKQKEFEDKYVETYDTEGNADAAQGYDYMNNAISAIEMAGSLDPEKIVEALSNFNREGLNGVYEFDEKDHTAKAGPDYIPVPAAQIQKGKQQIIWPENIATSEYEPQPWMK